MEYFDFILYLYKEAQPGFAGCPKKYNREINDNVRNTVYVETLI